MCTLWLQSVRDFGKKKPYRDKLIDNHFTQFKSNCRELSFKLLLNVMILFLSD